MLKVALTIDQYPARGSYNRVIGGYTKSQKDVMNQALGAIKHINTISEGMYGKKAISFEEDEVVFPKFKVEEES